MEIKHLIYCFFVFQAGIALAEPSRIMKVESVVGLGKVTQHVRKSFSLTESQSEIIGGIVSGDDGKAKPDLGELFERFAFVRDREMIFFEMIQREGKWFANYFSMDLGDIRIGVGSEFEVEKYRKSGAVPVDEEQVEKTAGDTEALGGVRFLSAASPGTGLGHGSLRDAAFKTCRETRQLRRRPFAKCPSVNLNSGGRIPPERPGARCSSHDDMRTHFGQTPYSPVSG